MTDSLHGRKLRVSGQGWDGQKVDGPPPDVRPRVYDRDMGRVIDLRDWQEHRKHDPMTRLERAIARLEELLRRRGSGRLGPRVESELLAITGAVTAGLQDEAAERAERLAERLDHPSASRSG